MTGFRAETAIVSLYRKGLLCLSLLTIPIHNFKQSSNCNHRNSLTLILASNEQVAIRTLTSLALSLDYCKSTFINLNTDLVLIMSVLIKFCISDLITFSSS